MREMSTGLAAVVGGIGRPGFEAELTRLLTAAAGFEQCNVFLLRDEASCAYAWHRSRPQLTEHLVRHYVADRCFAVDPMLRRLNGERRLGFVASADIADDWYRRFFFEEAGLDGKVSMLEAGGTVYLNFYSGGGRAFSDREIDNLSCLSQVVAECLARHHELSRRPGDRVAAVMRLLAERAPQLARRERQVCARIVAGFTGEAIALDLGIGEHSVATYRKRAYAKLGICSQHDLFSLCLDATRL